MSEVRVRFCPSPTGTPHVGMVRTALFNWAYARHTGGKLIFRIEDTDAARDSEESYQAIVDSLTWLGMDWDEGVEKGGPHAPYRQSQRMDIYADVLEKLKQGGFVYPAYSTAEEVEARHKAAGRDPKLGYDNYDRDLTDAQIAAFEAEGRKPVWRLRMPDTDWAWTDLVRGDIEFKAGSQPDFVVARSNGAPLYTLVNPVDDAIMGVTHVLRGEDLLPSTPRQLALYEALKAIGVAHHTPQFGHLPFVMGEGNKKLSKRDPQSDLFHHRSAGIIPEGMLNIWPSWAGPSRTNETSLVWRNSSKTSTSPTCWPTRRVSTRKNSKPSTPTTSANSRSTTSPAGSAPTLPNTTISPPTTRSRNSPSWPNWCKPGSKPCRMRGGW